MKKIALLAAFISFVACKEKPKNEEKMQPEVEQTIAEENFSEELTQVFDAHGGLTTWKSRKTLVFDLPNPNGTETHTIDLITRKDKVVSSNYTIGFDGKQVWLLDEEENYKGDPIFYHNLMFYFYAMPFVLADDGINYGSTDNLEFEGVSYPGIQITYDNGVGTSPKDEYYLHYNPETYQMEWLGYTVTYRTGEDSDEVKWIRYKDWMDIDGVLLPKSISWHNYDGRTINEERNTVTFENVSLSREATPDDFFNKPENAVYVAKE